MSMRATQGESFWNPYLAGALAGLVLVGWLRFLENFSAHQPPLSGDRYD